MAEQRKGRAIAPGQSVFENGRFYVAGDEDDLHAAKLPASEISRLTKAGVISGFGAKPIDDESLAADATIRAGEEDAVMEEDDEATGAELSETVHRDGLYSAETRKGAAGRKGGKK